ncbi:MAG: hypothetical protein AAFU57_08490 [Bacteroidota bacterium]
MKHFFSMTFMIVIFCQLGFSQNTSQGTGAGNSGEFNSSYGYYAGDKVNDDFNTFLGAYAGFNSTTTNYNVNLGARSGYSTTTGDNNSFVGYRSGYSNTSGFNNVFVGRDAGFKNVGGDYNTFIGSYAGYTNTANYNTFVGYQTGYLNSSGDFNTFLGFKAGDANTTASNNTFVGENTGQAVTTGGNNTFVGRRAGYSVTSGTGNVFLGNSAGAQETGSNRLYIDNSNATSPLIYGNFSSNQLGVNTNNLPSGYTLAVNGKTITTEVKVDLTTNWPDYVFDKNYSLPSLQEVKVYIAEKGHLINIPSAEEISQNNGFHLGEMNAKLLEKIEELTLYTLQQEEKLKKLEQVQVSLDKLLKVNALLIKRIEKLESSN